LASGPNSTKLSGYITYVGRIERSGSTIVASRQVDPLRLIHPWNALT